MKSASPESMTAQERLAEVTDILGAGVQRMFSHEIKQIPNIQNQQVPLAAEGLLKAACDSRVLNPKSKEPAA
jgi:hypothetical protein